jgi:Ni/Co efflux regulator RcnB
MRKMISAVIVAMFMLASVQAFASDAKDTSKTVKPAGETTVQTPADTEKPAEKETSKSN